MIHKAYFDFPEFEFYTAGKLYTIKNSVNDCEQSGGSMMAANYVEVKR